MYCNSRYCNARQTQGFAPRSLPLFFLHTLPVQCFTGDKIKRNDCKLISCPQVTYLLWAGTALKMTVTKKGEQNRFSASTCVTALSSRGWVFGGWGGGQLAKQSPRRTGNIPKAGRAGGSRSPPGWPPQQFHTKPISLWKKHAGQEGVCSRRCHPCALSDCAQLLNGTKFGFAFYCGFIWGAVLRTARGCPGSRTLPSAAQASALGQARGLTRAPNAPGSPVDVGCRGIYKGGQAQGGKNAFLLRREGMVGMDPGPGAGRGDVAARNGSNNPLRHVLGSSAGSCCPELRGTRSCLSLSCLQPGRDLLRQRRTSAGEGKDVQAATQGGGTRVKRSQGSHLSSPFAGSLLSQTPWAPAIKTQAQVSKPPPQL